MHPQIAPVILNDSNSSIETAGVPPEITILMPCLNESETLGACINKANQWILRSGVKAEILIADNGSTDGSQKLAESLGARVVTISKRGYGSALYFGSLAAKGTYIVMGDSDDSYDFSNLDPFLDKLRAGYELVMGNRFLGGIRPGAMPWKNRNIGNPVLTGIGRLLFNCPAGDFHCGLRAYSKQAFIRMDLRTSGMEFASEMIIKANLFGMRICEVPTTLDKDGRSRPPHLRPWRDGWRHLRFMLLFSPKWLFIYPGLVTFILSSLVFIALGIMPIHLGPIRFDLHTLQFAGAGVNLGFLALCFGCIVKMFGVREGLLPTNQLINILNKFPILEGGALLGILLFTVGFSLGIESLLQWGKSGFGELPSNLLTRQCATSTVIAILGGQIFMVSLIFGFLTLPSRRTSD